MCVNTILKTHEIADITDKGNCLAPARDVYNKLRLCLTCQFTKYLAFELGASHMVENLSWQVVSVM